MPGDSADRTVSSPALRRPRLCILDLDGTLVDSLRDIAEAVNHCLELLGLPQRPIPDYRFLVGDGIPMLCRRAIGETHPALVDRLGELARARYRVAPIVHTRPYPGMNDLISALAAAGTKLAVLSNKPHELTVRVVDAFWPPGTFAAVVGYMNDERRKPDPTSARAICHQCGVTPAETWLIGDTPTDIETARRLGSTCVSVTWGFRPREELAAAGATTFADSPEDIQRLVSG